MLEKDISLSHSHFDIFPSLYSFNADFAPIGNPPAIPAKSVEIAWPLILKILSKSADNVLLFSKRKKYEAKSDKTIKGNAEGSITSTEKRRPRNVSFAMSSDRKKAHIISAKNARLDFIRGIRVFCVLEKSVIFQLQIHKVNIDL